MDTPNFVALNKSQHQSLSLLNDSTFSHSANTSLASVGVNEFAQVAGCMPIVLIKAPDGEQFELAAMLGFIPGENLFYREAGWQGHAIPLSLQRYPFDYAIDGDKMLMLLNENSDRFGEGGEPLFSGEGEPMPVLKSVQNLLTELARGQVINKQFIAELERLDLLTPISFELEYTDGNKQNVQGCFSIDDKKMAELDKDTVFELHQSGAYGAINSLMLSIRQVNRLVQLSKSSNKPVNRVNIKVG